MKPHYVEGVFATALVALTSCLGPTSPEPLRYHAPEVGSVLLGTTGSEEPDAGGTALRLRRISAASSIQDRVAWRTPAGEFGFFELERWAENPVDLLERELARVLFEQSGFQRSEASSSLAMDVELVAFELWRAEPSAARAQAVVRLYDRGGGTALLERTFEARVNLPTDRPGPEFVRATGEALASLLQEVVESTRAALPRREP